MRGKRLRLIAILAVFAMLAAACGGAEAEPDADPEPDETATTAAAGGDDEPATTTTPDVAEPMMLAEVPGFDGTTISVGVISDLSGPAAILGQPIAVGAQVYFDKVNANGGIGGQYPVEVVELDSTYNPAVAVQLYSESKDDVVMFASTVGSAVTNGLVESLKADNILAVPGSLASDWVREPNLVPIGAPYEYQAINGLDWYINEGGGSADQVFCSLLQDDAAGEAAQRGYEFASENLGFTITDVARYVPGDTDFSSQVQQLQEGACDVVFLASTPSVTGAALGASAQAGFSPAWIGFSPSWINALLGAEALLPYLEANLTVVSEGPSWGADDVPGMADMIADLASHAPDQAPDYYVSFGYVQAQATVAILEEAVAGGDLSRDGMAAALERLGTVSYGGLMGDYHYGAPADRVPPTKNSIFAIDPEAPNGLRLLSLDYEASFIAEFPFE